MRVAFHTLGCKVNQYETEAMREEFASRGAEIVQEDEEADAYIVNTCTVTNLADRKSRQYIRRMKKKNPQAVMTVTGCYAQVSAEELEALEEVDLIIGNNLKSTICARVFAAVEARRENSEPAPHGESVAVLPYEALAEYEEAGIVVAGAASMCRAYIKIEEGCNRFCSYCLIPYARGRVRSRAVEEIMEEAKALVVRGYKELVLTGINTALYGTEQGFSYARTAEEEGLSGLEAVLRRLDEMPGDFRVRLSSLEPTVVDKEHVERLMRYRRLCHHLHLSVQSGSDTILQRMKRRYDRKRYLEIAAALRAYDPRYGITTDIIVGFPGETDDDFADTIDVVRQAGFGRVHAFRYSPRRGTEAATYAGAVSGKVKNERVKRLMEEAAVVAGRFNESNFAVTHRVLVEEREDGFATGYTDNYIKVYLEDPQKELEVGSFVEVKLTENHKDGCLGEAAGKGR